MPLRVFLALAVGFTAAYATAFGATHVTTVTIAHGASHGKVMPIDEGRACTTSS